MNTTHPLSYRLLGMLQEIAPTGSEQQRCATLYNELKMRFVSTTPALSENALAGKMAMILHDGLTYDNWPWTVFPRTTDKG